MIKASYAVGLLIILGVVAMLLFIIDAANRDTARCESLGGHLMHTHGSYVCVDSDQRVLEGL